MTKIKNLLLVPTLVFAACSKSQKEDNIQEYFTSGSTEAFYTNAKLNKESFLEADEAEDFFEDYSFNGVVVIKSKNKVKSYDQLYKEQIPESSSDQKSFNAVKKLGYKVQGKQHEVSHKISGYDFIYNFSFKENSDEMLELNAFNDHPVHVLHYSFNDDKGASFLVKSSTTDTLYAIYYIKKDSSGGSYHKLSAHQFSVAHNSTPVRWKSRYHNLNLCGDSSIANKKEVQAAIDTWKQAVGEKSLEVELEELPGGVYPPFSDLNTNCIYFIKDYLAADNSHVAMGRTHPIYNSNTNEMYSAPMFIFLNEIQKFPQDQQQSRLESTIVHEMGHFFGLGHPPHDSTAPSIMSYKDDSNKITQYDIQLYNDLYKDVDEVGFFSSWFN